MGPWTASGWQRSTSTDFAVVETFERFEGIPIQIAQGAALPQPGGLSAFANQTADVAGYGSTPTLGEILDLRIGTMRITGNETQNTYPNNPTYNAYTLASIGIQNTCGGDSGGPVIRNGKLIGVNSGASPSCAWYGTSHASFVVPSMLSALDSDGDGVTNSVDNCPSVPNADQANCDDGEEPQGQKLGDACDPNPCVHNLGAAEINKRNTGITYRKAAGLRVHYRPVGYQAPGATLQMGMDAYFCACHKPMGNGQNVDYWSDADCLSIACQTTNDDTPRDTVNDTGWLRMNWKYAYDDTQPCCSAPESCSSVGGMTDEDDDGESILRAS